MLEQEQKPLIEKQEILERNSKTLKEWAEHVQNGTLSEDMALKELAELQRQSHVLKKLT